MLPLSFSDLADSPTIISSPHQHQFDPITSRAAHSIYYHHQLRKPVMPTRYWDHPVIMSKSTPIPGNRASKRSHSEHEDDTSPNDMPISNDPSLLAKTPKSSPTNASNQFDGHFDTFEFEETMDTGNEVEATSNTILGAAAKLDHAGHEPAKPKTPKTEMNKKVRLQDGSGVHTPQTSPDGSSGQVSDTNDSQLDASESDDCWSGDPTSDAASNPVGSLTGGSTHYHSPRYVPYPVNQAADGAVGANQYQEPEIGDGTNEDQMDVDN